jgi:hypothetical protein
MLLSVTDMTMVSNIEVKSDKFNLATIGLSGDSAKRRLSDLTVIYVQPSPAARYGLDRLKESMFVPEKTIPLTGHGVS